MKKIDYKTYQKPTDFARFPQGDSVIRILTSGGLVKKHGMRTATGYVPMGDCTELPDCPQCLKGNEPKQKWIWIAYLRETKEVKILDVGPMVGDAICKLAQTKGDPQNYDLVINKAGQGLRTKYKVSGLGKETPLTDEEVKSTTAMKQFLIRKYLTPKEN